MVDGHGWSVGNRRRFFMGAPVSFAATCSNQLFFWIIMFGYVWKSFPVHVKFNAPFDHPKSRSIFLGKSNGFIGINEWLGAQWSLNPKDRWTSEFLVLSCSVFMKHHEPFNQVTGGNYPIFGRLGTVFLLLKDHQMNPVYVLRAHDFVGIDKISRNSGILHHAFGLSRVIYILESRQGPQSPEIYIRIYIYIL